MRAAVCVFPWQRRIIEAYAAGGNCDHTGPVYNMPFFAFKELGVTGNDVHLLKRMADGDETALLAFYRQYANLVFSMALHVLQEHAAAEEATQDVFMTIWRRAALYDPGRGSVSSWLLTMARHRAIDYHRRMKRLPARIDDSDAALGATNLDAPDLDLRAAVDTLSPQQRECVRLVYFGGLTQQEAAATLGIPVGTLKSRLRLALNRLRQAMHEPDLPE